MKKTIISITLCLFTLGACNDEPVVYQGENKRVEEKLKTGAELVKVNETVIYDGFLNLLASINPQFNAQLNNPITRRKLLDNLIDQELLLQESIRRGLDKSPLVEEKKAIYERVIIAQALLQDELEKAAKKEYEATKSTDFTKIELAHIFVNFDKVHKNPGDKKSPKIVTPQTKAAAKKEATEIYNKLKSGAQFGELVKKHSDDKASVKKEGSLGKVGKEDKRMERRGYQPLVKVALTLKEGEISQPIETNKGYHIVKLIKGEHVIPFEEAQKTILFKLKKKVKVDLVKNLKEKADITFFDKKGITATDAPKTEEAKDAHEHGGHEGHDH